MLSDILDSDVPVPKVPLTCCYNSTIADAVVGLLRHLYTFPKWTTLITRQLLCGIGNSYAASLAFVGGITNKPRIGGDIITQDGRHGIYINFSYLLIAFSSFYISSFSKT